MWLLKACVHLFAFAAITSTATTLQPVTGGQFTWITQFDGFGQSQGDSFWLDPSLHPMFGLDIHTGHVPGHALVRYAGYVGFQIPEFELSTISLGEITAAARFSGKTGLSVRLLDFANPSGTKASYFDATHGVPYGDFTVLSLPRGQSQLAMLHNGIERELLAHSGGLFYMALFSPQAEVQRQVISLESITLSFTPGSSPLVTPLPGAFLLAGSGLLGLFGFATCKSRRNPPARGLSSAGA